MSIAQCLDGKVGGRFSVREQFVLKPCTLVGRNVYSDSFMMSCIVDIVADRQRVTWRQIVFIFQAFPRPHSINA